MFTKEDYLKLPKERLAEMLVERDMAAPCIPTWDLCPLSGGQCTNPFHDCINCPRHHIGVYYTTCTSTFTNSNEEN